MTRRVHVHYLAVGGATATHRVLPLSLLLERAEAAPKRYEGTRTPWLGCACRVLLC